MNNKKAYQKTFHTLITKALADGKFKDRLTEKEFFYQMKECLTERQQYVIVHRYSLNQQPFKTLNEIAEELARGSATIRVIEVRALRAMENQIIKYLKQKEKRGFLSFLFKKKRTNVNSNLVEPRNKDYAPTTQGDFKESD